MGMFGFSQKRLEPKQHSRCHSVSFAMYISGAKFEEHCSNISGDILDSVFCCLSGTIYDLLYLLVSTRAVIGQFSGPYSCTAR